MPHFTEDQAQRIFARAAERQHAAGDAPAGFSLDELTEIGAAAGLSPEHIAAAVAEVGNDPQAEREPARFLGVDLEPRAVRVLPAPLTDALWGRLVGEVRPSFQTNGVTSEVGVIREWNGTNEHGGLSNLRMTAEPVEGGTRVILETSRAREARQSWGGVGALGIPVAIFAAGGFVLGEPGIFVIVAFLLVLASAFPIGYRVAFGRWSQRRQREFDRLLDRFELVARDAAEACADIASPMLDAPGVTDSGGPISTPPIDLDELADAPDAEGHPNRSRTRS